MQIFFRVLWFHDNYCVCVTIFDDDLLIKNGVMFIFSQCELCGLVASSCSFSAVAIIVSQMPESLGVTIMLKLSAAFKCVEDDCVQLSIHIKQHILSFVSAKPAEVYVTVILYWL